MPNSLLLLSFMLCLLAFPMWTPDRKLSSLEALLSGPAEIVDRRAFLGDRRPREVASAPVLEIGIVAAGSGLE